MARRHRPTAKRPDPLNVDEGLVIVERDGVLMAVCECEDFYLCGHCYHETCLDCGECAVGPCRCACWRSEQEQEEEANGAAPRFYLGTHMPNWLWSNDPRFEDTTFFVSVNRFERRVTPMPRATRSVCFDSGGFTVLKKHGGWPIGAEEYVERVRRYRSELGKDRVVWIAPQDWMCEPWVIYGKNQHLGPRHRDYFHGTKAARGLAPDDPEHELDTAVAIHQQYTVDNYLDLRRLAPELPVIPVLQGWELGHYLDCLRLYEEAGVDLTAQPVVGLGSVCRRQATAEIKEIVQTLAGRGLRLHGFGVKTKGLAAYADSLVSADSLAWSQDARYSAPLPGHEGQHKSCANCPDWAASWHHRIKEELVTAA
ncbi:deazapurine DNA modification protein DpdA family protein [Streptomyces marianii]|uniref:DeoxyPurine in DNA protein A domain-containing protein n=1 Tax=Streptomyces marianii TaxID=1817406 RepID=A0A5R9DW60_9ACTN|nr:hypothetical protein [Streptomyces marianii]TLQ39011.1 hypothetical protein FEF34_40080 [Streptomyces marianii]